MEGQIDIYYDYGLFDNEYTGRNNCNNNLYKLSIFTNIEDTSNNCIEIKFYSWYKKYSFRLITLFLSKNLDDLRGSVYYSNDNFNTILFQVYSVKSNCNYEISIHNCIDFQISSSNQLHEIGNFYLENIDELFNINLKKFNSWKNNF